LAATPTNTTVLQPNAGLFYAPTIVRTRPYDWTRFYPAWSHPEVLYWAETWQKIRDCILGEEEIKLQGEAYLPRMEDMEDHEYDAYKERGVFFNMTARTINSLTGTLFQRPPQYKGIPKRLEDKFNLICYDRQNFDSFLFDLVEELCGPGRAGLLVDRPADGQGDAFLRAYDAEHILDWQEDIVDGRKQPVQIVLRELVDVVDRRVGTMRQKKIVLRVLSLDIEGDTPIYRQYIYDMKTMGDDLSKVEATQVTPTNRGVPFRSIPFWFVGARNNTAKIDRPPASDIAGLNLAHYRTYAHLEHGRFYTAMPVYYVQLNPSAEKAEYTLGPSRVWETAVGEKPGILEFHGSGLITLENSLSQKEEQIAQIGGRLMGGGSKSVSESGDAFKIKETNERTLLLKIANNVTQCVSAAVNVWATWQDETDPKIAVEINVAFLFDNLGARELRAAHQMYKEGVIPLTALHSYLQKAEVVPDWMDIDQFKGLLSRIDEFPNQPDVWAMMMGYSDQQQRQDVLLQRRQIRQDQSQHEDIIGLQQHANQTERMDVQGNLKIKQQQVANQKKIAAQGGGAPSAGPNGPAPSQPLKQPPRSVSK
jgi:hypothetical protein